MRLKPVSFTTKFTIVLILVNLMIGNLILFVGGKSSFGEDINYPLMAGMSISTIIIYFLFFRFNCFQNGTTLKLFLLCVLCCMLIILIGNSIALLIHFPTSEILKNFPAAIFMGFFGNIIFFPIVLLIALINVVVIKYLTRKV